MIFLSNLANSESDDFSEIPNILEYYERAINDASVDVKLTGRRIEEISKMLPGLVLYRFNQLQELEAILEILQKRLERLRSKRVRFFMEQYDRALTSRDAEKFADGDDEIFSVAMICNQVALLRNKFLGVTKSIEAMSFQINNIVKLRVAGIEDATL